VIPGSSANPVVFMLFNVKLLHNCNLLRLYFNYLVARVETKWKFLRFSC